MFFSQLMIPFGHVCPYKGYAGLPVRARGSSILHFFVNRGEYKHTIGITAGALNNNKQTSQFSKWLPNIYLTDWPKLFLQTDFFSLKAFPWKAAMLSLSSLRSVIFQNETDSPLDNWGFVGSHYI